MSTISPEEYILKNRKKVTIRSALVKDAAQVVKLMKGVIKEGPFTLYESDEYRSTAKSEAKKIKRFKEAHGKIYLVAEIKDEITGFISFDNWDTRRTTHTGLFSIFLKKKFRSLGIGKLLIKSMLNWGKNNPVNKKISLAVFSTNKSAIALYKKLGFKREGCCPRDMIINGKYVDSILMYKYTK
ncbi:MAG: GNAT family N-acetyltransferase [Ignavibacteria bacterium]|nr:GNAT family N-acetyltransferase [Ignavibacteria bacterium]